MYYKDCYKLGRKEVDCSLKLLKKTQYLQSGLALEH